MHSVKFAPPPVTGVVATSSSHDDSTPSPADATRTSTWNSLAANPLALSSDASRPKRLRQLANEVIRQENPVRIELVPGTDIVHVRIKGDADLFKSVGFPGMDTSAGLKRLEYLVVPADKYTPHLAGGGNKQYTITNMKDSAKKALLSANQSLVSKIFLSKSPGPTAFVNGGFYGNTGTRIDEIGIKTYAAHAPFGSAKVKGVKQIEGVRPQDEYMADYHRVDFPNGSHVTLAPLLAAVNKETGQYESQFTAEKAADPKYVFENTPLNRPGELGHASHPNARSGLDLPAVSDELPGPDSQKTNSVRLAVAGDDSGVRGANSAGMTMVEWSNAMTRLGSFNQNPGRAWNCDGGSSALVGVIDKKGKSLLEIRGIESEVRIPTAANFIAVAHNKKGSDAKSSGVPKGKEPAETTPQSDSPFGVATPSGAPIAAQFSMEAYYEGIGEEPPKDLAGLGKRTA